MAKYLVVERQKVRNNIQNIKKRAGSAQVFGVLKGNGYGFGLLEMAQMLREEGVSSFAITEPRDLIVLRNSGFIDEEILMMRSTSIPEEIEKFIEYNAIVTIGSNDAAIAVNGIAEKNQAIVEAHIEIDTGMGRYGFVQSEIDRVISMYKYMSNIHVVGLYTHFNRAFASAKAVKDQFETLKSVAEAIKAAGYNPGLIHCANSSALLKHPYTAADAVRIGSALTGRAAVGGNFGLSKTGYAEARIVEIRWLQKGQTVGYGADYKCRKSIRAAVVPLGYADGFCTEKQRDMFRFKDALLAGLSGLKSWITRKKITATVNGKSAHIIGHVGMQHTVLDVTKLNCTVGDYAKFDINPLLSGNLLPRKYV